MFHIFDRESAANTAEAQVRNNFPILGCASFTWVDCPSLAPFTGLSAAAVLGPPFTAGASGVKESLKPRSRGFSVFGLSRLKSFLIAARTPAPVAFQRRGWRVM